MQAHTFQIFRFFPKKMWIFGVLLFYYTILLLKYHLGQIKHLFELLVPISWCPQAPTLLIFSGSMTTANPCETLGYFPSNSHNLALYHRLSLKILALSGMLRKQPPLPDVELVTVSRTLKACKVQAGWQIGKTKKNVRATYLPSHCCPVHHHLQQTREKSPPPKSPRLVVFWQQGPISWETIFPPTRVRGWFFWQHGPVSWETIFPPTRVRGWFQDDSRALHLLYTLFLLLLLHQLHCR